MSLATLCIDCFTSDTFFKLHYHLLSGLPCIYNEFNYGCRCLRLGLLLPLFSLDVLESVKEIKAIFLGGSIMNLGHHKCP